MWPWGTDLWPVGVEYLAKNPAPYQVKRDSDLCESDCQSDSDTPKLCFATITFSFPSSSFFPFYPSSSSAYQARSFLSLQTEEVQSRRHSGLEEVLP